MATEVSSIKDLTKSLKTYMDSDQLEQVKKAFFFAANAHSGQYRVSGDPYVTHPVAVAEILAKFKMDGDSLSAAMLHDVIEDSGIPKSFLSKEFNKDVANLVDGVSKLDKIKISGKEDEQAEYFQKMVLAMSQDIRVIVVKLADRLHNMRTLNHLATAKQKRISKETIEIYAPIAHRIGMHQIYRELEDRAFEVLNPHRATILRKAIDTATKGRKKILSKIEKSIKEKLKENNLIGDVVGRQKHLYGIFKKMRKQGKPLSEVLDVYAFKITVESAMDCYKALGVLHNAFSPIEGRFKDYIAIPKSNSYQSLHTGIMTFEGLPVEIQIRTNDMDELAEYGIAAHWVYKNSKSSDIDKNVRWLRELLEIRGYESFKFTIKGNHIFVEGELNGNKSQFMIDTGAGSTVLHIEAAKEKGCKVGPLDQVIFGIGGEAPAALTEVPEIRLGQAFIKDQVLLSADMFKDIPNARKEYDAVLGAEFMSKMREL